MKIGLQLYTVRDMLAADVWGAMDALAETGYRNLEAAGTHGLSAAEYAKGVRERGMRFIGMHVGLDALEDGLARVMADAEALGTTNVVLPWISSEDYALGWDKFADRIRPVAEKLQAEGFQFLYHNHEFEFEGDRPGLETFYAHADKALVKAELDLYWVAFGGQDPVSWLHRLSGRVPLAHFKDGSFREALFTPVGQGVLDWEGIVPAAKEAGVEYAIVELDSHPDPMKAVRESHQFLRDRGLED